MLKPAATVHELDLERSVLDGYLVSEIFLLKAEHLHLAVGRGQYIYVRGVRVDRYAVKFVGYLIRCRVVFCRVEAGCKIKVGCRHCGGEEQYADQHQSGGDYKTDNS